MITDRNLPHMLDIYRFLRGHGVDQVVFNVMQANGRANTYFEQIFPRYTDIAADVRALLRRRSARRSRWPSSSTSRSARPRASPTSTAATSSATATSTSTTQAPLPDAQEPERAQDGKGKGLVLVDAEDLDDAQRDKRPECASCRYDRQCEGVWNNYVKRYGWEEFAPIA